MTPIADAYVYVPIGGIRGETRQPTEASITWTQSDALGHFLLENIPVGTATIKIVKGAFHTQFDSTVTEGQTTSVPAADTTLPSTGAGAPKIAVVTGNWDRIQDVLAKLGLGQLDASGELVLGTEKFKLYDGNSSLDDATYPNADTLFTSLTEMQKYDIIFINCGTDYEGLLTSNPNVVPNLQNYVTNGGSLYVTDLSYDYVEQAFPAYIAFYGDPVDPNQPGVIDTAQVGESGITTDATVLDNTLKNWLDNLGALNPDKTVHIEGFLSGWAVMNAANTSLGTKAWVQGSVSYYGTLARGSKDAHSRQAPSGRQVSAVKPLTVTFTKGKGRVLYSSYHTEESPSPTLRPQERILAYLVFEVS